MEACYLIQDHFAKFKSDLRQENNGSSKAMDLDRIEVTNDASGAVSVFKFSKQVQAGAGLVSVDKFWVSSSSNHLGDTAY